MLCRAGIVSFTDGEPAGTYDDDGEMTRAAQASGTEPVRRALGLVDPLGVLSVYVAARDASTPGNTALREVEVELGRLRRSVGTSWATAAAPARAALDGVEQRVRGDTLSGQARNLALFVALGRGETVAVEPAGTVPTRTTFGPRADVRPLLLALDEARPAGVALVSAEGVRVLEWTPGVLTDVWAEELPELEERELVGPAHAHPRGAPGAAPGFLVRQQRDLFESRIRGELERLLVGAGRRVANLSHERGWKELAVAGDDRLTSSLTRGLPNDTQVEIALVAHLEQWRSTGELAQRVAPAIAGVRAALAAADAEAALVNAEGAGRAARGLRETLRALDDARVDTLLIAADPPIAGRSSALGRLAPPGEMPPGVTEAELVDDPMLADAMIAQAFDTAAAIVVLSTEAAGALGGDDVAALLRY